MFVTIGILMSVLVIVLWFRSRNQIVAGDEVYTGRQQIRKATRDEAYRQIRGAPVSRRLKRLAARSMQRKRERP